MYIYVDSLNKKNLNWIKKCITQKFRFLGEGITPSGKLKVKKRKYGIRP